jgi:pimeloyl-ACP methyl ester carboxylesterase
MNPSHHVTVANGTSVHYWSYHTDKPTTLILIHGFRGTHHGLAKIAEQLPDFHLIVPDLPGFGESEAYSDRPHTLEHYVETVKGLIDALNTSQPIIVGHSFGSIVASHLVAKYPDVAKKLILINPIGAPALEGPRGFMTRLAIGYYWLGRTLPQKASQKWLGAPPIVKIMSITMAKTKDKTIRKYIHDQHLRHFSTFAHPNVVAESFRTSVENDVAAVANQITLPTLLVVGEKDDITSLDKQRELHSQFKQASLHVISDVGHLIHYETPTEAAEAIRAFLTR